MTAGRGIARRSLRTTAPLSASTISAFPSITRRKARRTGTIVSGSNDALSARQRTDRPPGDKMPPRSPRPRPRGRGGGGGGAPQHSTGEKRGGKRGG